MINRKSLFTSVFALGLVCPALAVVPEDHRVAFPANKLMLENYEYINAAVRGNMDGVYENNDTVYAIAQYEKILYDVLAGKYLPAGATEAADCTDGNYCPGIADGAMYDETNNQGLESCPDGYAHSDTGANANTQCYRSCNIANMGTGGSVANIEHATALTGNDYYGGMGDGYDTCEPSECVEGWHLKTRSGVSEITSQSSVTGVNSAIMPDGEYSFQEYTGGSASTHDATYYGLTEGTWAVEFSSASTGRAAIVRGTARLSKVNGSVNGSTRTTLTQLGGAGGNNCYCKLTAYQEIGSWHNVSSPWVYLGYGNTAEECFQYCANSVREVASSDFKTALFNAAFTPASCEANVIKVKWYGTTLTDVTTNNAGTVTYGGDINTPVKATVPRGQVFRGWRFSKTQPATGTPANPD